jgi:hypothetical protein
VIATFATIAVGAFLLLELAAPLERVDLPSDHATLAVYEALADKPHGAVVELPVIVPTGSGSEWAFVEAPRMVYSSHGWRSRFNGYSGGTPDDYFQDADELNTFPSAISLATMRRLEIRYAILHIGPYEGVAQFTEAQADAVIRALPPGTRVERHGDSRLVDLARE